LCVAILTTRHILTDTDIGKHTPLFTEALDYKMKRAKALGLSFDPDKSEVTSVSGNKTENKSPCGIDIKFS
jgi:hypothetical protein